jgi:hypothetical protein
MSRVRRTTPRASWIARHTTRSLALLACFTTLTVSLPEAASAAPPFLARFPENTQKGSGADQLSGTLAVATDPLTGYVHVVDAVNSRVDEFSPWGEFVRAFGWDVAPAG